MFRQSLLFSRYSPYIAIFITAAFHASFFLIYLYRTLKGDINYFTLPGDMFGLPHLEIQNGLKPLYFGPGQTGWDGQFYFHMANDPLGVTDAPSHIDSPAYRYQRIGLSVLVFILSKTMFLQWATPSFYFLVYSLLILLAVFFGAKTLVRFNFSGFWILGWSLQTGVQVTWFNALPDAAADSFLIISIYLLSRHKPRIFLGALFLTLAGLTRESHIMFSIAILIAALIFEIRTKNCATEDSPGIYKKIVNKESLVRLATLSIPLVTWISWQAYIAIHFGKIASSQATGILGFPGASLLKYTFLSLSGNHPIAKWPVNLAELASLTLFFATIFLTLIFSALYLRKHFTKNFIVTGMVLGSIFQGLIALCFGDTVMMHYSGYLKAITFLNFTAIFVILNTLDPKIKKKASAILCIFLTFGIFATTFYNYHARVAAPEGYSKETNSASVTSTTPQACWNDYKLQLKLVSSHRDERGQLGGLLGNFAVETYDVVLTNDDDKSMMSTLAQGGFYLSGQELFPDGSVAIDGIRSAILGKLAPGESQDLKVVRPMKKDSENRRFVISLVQEGCAWTYKINPETGLVIDLHS